MRRPTPRVGRSIFISRTVSSAAASESAESGTEAAGDRSPSYSASITVTEQDGASEQGGTSEQTEASALAAKATATRAQAKDAALAAVP